MHLRGLGRARGCHRLRHSRHDLFLSRRRDILDRRTLRIVERDLCRLGDAHELLWAHIYWLGRRVRHR